MDFKVAGTEQRRHLAADGHQDRRHHRGDHARWRSHQAREGRLHILGEMAKASAGRARRCARPCRGSPDPDPDRQDRRRDRPRRQDDPRDHRATGAKIDIDDDGMVKIASSDATAQPARGRLDPRPHRRPGGRRDLRGQGGADRRLRRLRQLPRQPATGSCHISELANERVGKVTDVVKEGDKVKVKVMAIDDRGKIKLSRCARSTSRPARSCPSWRRARRERRGRVASGRATASRRRAPRDGDRRRASAARAVDAASGLRTARAPGATGGSRRSRSRRSR